MKNGLIFGLEDRPPLRDTLFAAMQHLLAIFVAIITPPLIISGALGFDVETTSFLISMSLFVSGIATFIQCKRFGGVGWKGFCTYHRFEKERNNELLERLERNLRDKF